MTGAYFLGGANHQVTAKLVIADTISGEKLHLYRGDILPVNVLPAQIDTLLADQHIVKLSA